MTSEKTFNLGDRKKDQVLREKLAEYAHEAWSGWMKHLFKLSDKVTLPDGQIVPQLIAECTDRWLRQMMTSYVDLIEEEKESSRKEADKILGVLALLLPKCEDCGIEVPLGRGIERSGRLSPLCHVCQAKRITKFKTGK